MTHSFAVEASDAKTFMTNLASTPDRADFAGNSRSRIGAIGSVTARVIEAPDVVLVGSGIMSATLAVMLKRLDPRLRVQMVEVTTELAREASDGWNNAGTGHAGVCEMSYTPTRDPDARVPIARALRIFEQFEHSKQFWGTMSATGVVGDPAGFIHEVPHLCFVKGAGGRTTRLSGDLFGELTDTGEPAAVAKLLPPSSRATSSASASTIESTPPRGISRSRNGRSSS